MFSTLTLLVIGFAFKSVQCLDCSVIYPNREYNGFQVYRRYSENGIKNWMSNGIDREWQFEVSGNELLFDWNTTRATKRVRNRFSFTLGQNDPTVDCDAFEVYISCRIFVGNREIIAKSFFLDHYKNSFHIDMKTNDLTFIEINAEDKKDRAFFRFKSLNHMSSVDRIDRIQCQDTMRQCQDLFFDRMDETLFRRLNSSIIWSDVSVLMFNFDSRPKYCIQRGLKTLSPNCSSADRLTNVFDECSEYLRDINSNPNQPTNPSTVMVILIVVIVVLSVSLAVIAIIAWNLYRKSRKVDENDSSHSVTEKINERIKDKKPFKIMKFKTEELDKEFGSKSSDKDSSIDGKEKNRSQSMASMQSSGTTLKMSDTVSSKPSKSTVGSAKSNELSSERTTTKTTKGKPNVAPKSTRSGIASKTKPER